MLIAAGVVTRPLLPTLLRFLVIHQLPRCVSVGMRSIRFLFLHGALDSHWFFPARAVLRQVAAF